MLDAERFTRMERLYLRVLDSPPERRIAVLEESCSDDPELLRELESLLEAREHAGSFLWLLRCREGAGQGSRGTLSDDARVRGRPASARSAAVAWRADRVDEPKHPKFFRTAREEQVVFGGRARRNCRIHLDRLASDTARR